MIVSIRIYDQKEAAQSPIPSNIFSNSEEEEREISSMNEEDTENYQENEAGSQTGAASTQPPLQPQNPQLLAQQQMLQAFWTNQLTTDFKTHTLPIARIKKVMKSDIDVKSLMISAEAPIMFAKACEIFVEELTLRAWMHAEENKRRTIQKSDIATAVSNSDMYDFLIDIVPRDSDFIKANGAFTSHTGRSSSAQQPKNANLEDMYDNPYAYAYHPVQIPNSHEQMYTPAYHPADMQHQYQMYSGEDYERSGQTPQDSGIDAGMIA